jgi:predicted alpha/beta-fold hydrolase
MKSFPAIAVLVAVMGAGLAAADEPQFDFAYADGLYATITLPKRISKPALKGEVVKLPAIPGFRKEMTVRALWQIDGAAGVRRAPLAVPLLGLAGRNKDDLAGLWQSLLYETGCHVMTADSTFSYDFNEISGQGVAGNIAAEAEAIAKVIAAFLGDNLGRGKVTEVRLLGASYGGNVALYMAKMEREGKLQFPLGPVLALSPPVSLRDSARILDSFYDEDFAAYNYNPYKLVKLRSEDVVSPTSPVPFDPQLMRAGIGYVFRNDLKRIVKKNDKLYNLHLIETHKRLGDKQGRASGWTFTEFVEEMSFPYWRDKGKVETVDELWSMGDLENLLSAVNGNVRVYVSHDDPLNDPADVAALETGFGPPLFNVLPGGGHLGFAESEWVKQTVKNTFGSPAE